MNTQQDKRQDIINKVFGDEVDADVMVLIEEIIELVCNKLKAFHETFVSHQADDEDSCEFREYIDVFTDYREKEYIMETIIEHIISSCSRFSHILTIEEPILRSTYGRRCKVKMYYLTISGNKHLLFTDDYNVRSYQPYDSTFHFTEDCTLIEELYQASTLVIDFDLDVLERSCYTTKSARY